MLKQKRWWTQAFLLFLAVVMALSCVTLTACKEDSPNVPVTPEDPSGPDDPQEQRIPLNLPERNYGGVEFHVLEWTTSGNETAGGSEWLPWEEIAIDEKDRDLVDVIGSEVYNRNLAVGEKYGVTITREYGVVNENKIITQIVNNDTAGDDEYQMITIRTLQTPTLTQGNYLLNLRDEAYSDIFHFDQPWWVGSGCAQFLPFGRRSLYRIQ